MPLALLPRGAMLSMSAPLTVALSGCHIHKGSYILCELHNADPVRFWCLCDKTLGGTQYNITVKSGLVRLQRFIRLWIRSPHQKSRHPFLSLGISQLIQLLRVGG